MTSVLTGSDVGLTATDLTISYDARPAVHQAGFTLEPGKVTAFIGPNGSGKSTLLRTVARLHKPDSGSVTLGDDERVDAFALSSRDFAKRVTLLTQGRPTPGGTTVKEVVDYGRHPHRSRWTAKDPDGAAVVERAMRLTNTHELTDSPVAALSGGQLQRVWLASCLAQDTQVLLLDEPTTYLDLRYQVEILDVIRDLAVEHGVTVGVVLHDLDQAAAIADHLVLLEAGTITTAGSAAHVLTAENLTRAFGVRVDVTIDAATGSLTTRAVGRHTYLSLTP
ncbi:MULTISPECIES: ABC transporter ATP-binding protein [unclassified Arthrobacter]|uniref:ABC transporter ATP-binding protein n=1 Tax=unclassified Arthrobacter TaxID=235627 RepID=UPI001491015A|nr:MULTISPECIES: ABC transporter ATP-binding protein [unclassified Arthrobacter]MBE0009687.1 ABC transporter ATP-binding protein [Arthrobacter sp. AET 35A]NOJ63621.1 ABC transporter ATP-binding protein [Arthrobacter sp. 147(2020)]